MTVTGRIQARPGSTAYGELRESDVLSKVLSSGARCPTGRPAWSVRVRDRVQAGDPALARLRSGWRMLMVFPAALGAGYAMARALGQPGLFGLTFGGMVGLICGLSIFGPKPGKVVVRCVWCVPAMLIAMFCAIEIQPYRIPALIASAAALCVQLALTSPTLGEFWRDSGTMFFTGFLGGVLAPVPVAELKYIAAITAAAALAAGFIQALACRTRPESGFASVERGYLSRVRDVVRLSTKLLEAGPGAGAERASRRLSRAMVRLNESAMLVDGYLPASGLSGPQAARRHTLVFDTERAAHAVGRVVARLCGAPLPDEVRPLLLTALAGLGGRSRPEAAVPDGTGALLAWLARHEDDTQDPDFQLLVTRLYRFVAVLADLHRTAHAWTAEDGAQPVDRGVATASADPFTTAITLVRGKLPGTHLLTTRTMASGTVRGSWGFLGKIGPQSRIVVQAAVSLAIAVPLGDLISGRRYYWAMIGVMIMLVGTNSPHERVRKTIARVLGTAVGCAAGVVVGDLLKTNHPWASLILVCAAMAIGAYAITSYYYIWGGALAFVLIQLYGWSTGFQDSVILLRAGENGLGGVIATLVGLVVLPVASRTLWRRAHATDIRALAAFVRDCGAVWSGESGADGTRGQARAIDQATHELHTFTRSLLPIGAVADRAHAQDVRATMQQAAHFARDMSVTGAADLTPAESRLLLHITDTMATSLDALANTVADDAPDSHPHSENDGKVRRADDLPCSRPHDGNDGRMRCTDDPQGGRPHDRNDGWVRCADDLRSLQDALSAAAADSALRDALYYLGHLDDLLGDLALRLGMPVHGADYRSAAQPTGRELYTRRALRTAATAS